MPFFVITWHACRLLRSPAREASLQESVRLLSPRLRSTWTTGEDRLHATMRFTLQNLGRLEEATIDLGKDLIVLTGPNNTSKTYVAHAIYGFCVGARFDVFRELDSNTSHLLSAVTSSSDDRLEIDLAKLVRERLTLLLKHLGQRYTVELPDVFATDRSFTSRAVVTLACDADEVVRLLADMNANNYEIGDRDDSLSCGKPSGASILTISRSPSRAELGTSARGSKVPLQEYAPLVVAPLVSAYLLGGLSESFILTAERSAIQLFSRELSIKRSDLIDSLLKTTAARAPGGTADPLTLLRQGARRYPLAIRDSLRIADDLSEARKSTAKRFQTHADALEHDLLQGRVHVTDDGEMRFRPAGGDADLGLHLASSSVKSLAPLSFYLRHLARAGHFVIIDEPELNLHPHNQRRVARLLARMARAGIKVMISTHSDYIIRELNNLIMLSADEDGKLREKYGYREEEILSPDRVGAYAFDGARAHLLPIERAGIPVKAIDQEIRDQNHASRDIYFSLFDEDEA